MNVNECQLSFVLIYFIWYSGSLIFSANKKNKSIVYLLKIAHTNSVRGRIPELQLINCTAPEKFYSNKPLNPSHTYSKSLLVVSNLTLIFDVLKCNRRGSKLFAVVNRCLEFPDLISISWENASLKRRSIIHTSMCDWFDVTTSHVTFLSTMPFPYELLSHAVRYRMSCGGLLRNVKSFTGVVILFPKNKMRVEGLWIY